MPLDPARPSASHRSLLRAWRAGDERAGRELLATYVPVLYRFFRTKIGGGVTDLAHEALTACLDSPMPEKDVTVRVHLLTQARRILVRRTRGDRSLCLDPETVRVGGSSARDTVRRALQTLPLDLQIAMELRYWERLGPPDVARVLGVSEDTARGRLARGREMVRSRLGMDPLA